MVPSDRTRDKGHNLEHRMFHLNIRKHFTVQVMDQSHRLPREVVESSSLEILRSCLNMVLDNLLQVSIFEQEAWTT